MQGWPARLVRRTSGDLEAEVSSFLAVRRRCKPGEYDVAEVVVVSDKAGIVLEMEQRYPKVRLIRKNNYMPKYGGVRSTPSVTDRSPDAFCCYISCYLIDHRQV